jgi:hypothetical protein
MKDYKSGIEFISRLVVFLLPLYIVAKIYSIIRTREYNYLNIIITGVCIVILIVAYLFLTPGQRYYPLAMLIVLIITLSVTLTIAKIFKW